MTKTQDGTECVAPAPDDDIETLLADVREAGQWEDRHEDMLWRWRNRRHEAGIGETPWRWWWKLPRHELFQCDFATREEAIGAAVAQHPGVRTIEIVEARCWDDDFGAGDECLPFAHVRNRETVQVAANDGVLYDAVPE